MHYRMFQRCDQHGMLVLVPMPQAPSPEAHRKHGPLEAVGAIDAERETDIDWDSVRCELDIYGYATLPRDALSRSDLAPPQQAQSS
jgi:hypothetical protein